MGSLRDRITKLKTENSGAFKRVALGLVLSVCVVFGTLFGLLLPAYTMSKTTYCGVEEHTHTAECYEKVLSCGLEENEGHTHTEACTETVSELICGLEESEAVEATEDSEGSPGHKHTEACYQTVTRYVCGLEETEGHQHTDACYEDVLICGQVEHVHTKQCYSNPNAVESRKTWEATIPEFTDEQSKIDRFLAVAESQLGYKESAENFEVQSDGSLKGYSRYGDWYGVDYGDWCAMFASFCLSYAGIEKDVVPYAAGCQNWIDSLTERGMFVSREQAMPKRGDLIFFDFKHEGVSHHVGIVSEVDLENNQVKTIEGNTSNQVARKSYALDEDAIVGYGVLPGELGRNVVAETLDVTDTEETGIDHFEQTAYVIKVTADAEKGVFPEGTEMRIKLLGANQVYDAVTDAISEEVGRITAVDISFWHDDVEIEPNGPVNVQITTNYENAYVVHVDEEGNGSQVDAQTEDGVVSFSADGFSVYVVVEAPEPAQIVVQTVQELDELTENTPFYISYGSPSSFATNQLNSNGCLIEDGSSSNAAEWYFEKDDNGKYYVYTLIDGQKQYIKSVANGQNEIKLDSESGTALDITKTPETGKFFFKKDGQNRWLQHSNGGKGIRFYTENKDVNNARLVISYPNSYHFSNDPYHLDGETFGIAYYNLALTGVSLSTEPQVVNGKNRLAGKDLVIRPDVLDNDGFFLVSEGEDVTEWTFEYIHDDLYYIKTVVDGAAKYLTLNGTELTLSDTPDETYSQFAVQPGTGSNAGKWNFSVGGYVLNSDGGTSKNGFNGWDQRGTTTWLSLVRKTEVIEDDDFNVYSAKKVSVSNTQEVSYGQQVIIYTRVWNEETLEYEFYGVDHDGTLFRCYDNGDVIEWIASSVNTELWKFIEYYDVGTTTPNYYYDLQNVYSGKYIAPQLQGGQIFSNSTIGVNMNGRRYGDDYTTIITWDDPYYEYVGLKVENGKVVPCPLAETDDFYFAIINTPEVAELTTVDTIDNDDFGITMKMVDFNDPNQSAPNTRNSSQTNVLGYDTNKPNMVSTDLDSEGYPVTNAAVTGKDSTSLKTLFGPATEVNHLFIESTYNESGYFEYNSTQNYAYLADGKNFTVYDQLGVVAKEAAATSKEHGHFLPYNSLANPETGKAWPYSTFVTNQTDTINNPLPDTDPRKGEQLIEIPWMSTDYFFGMEMEAKFTQTPNGLDAWGHDIIFEFSGDDDFWFYVDGELVLDLGGVHSAMTGKINFRTGVVTYMNHARNMVTSSLYEIFKKNYKTRNPEATSDEVNAYLDEIFVLNAEGNRVFKDYSNHTMKMFFMERGAGASNLHMRFNLAAVKPGTVVLSKTISGTDKLDYSLAEFP